MADVWCTKMWDHRVFAESLGMCMVNTILAWNNIVCPMLGYEPFEYYLTFKRELAWSSSSGVTRGALPTATMIPMAH